MPNPRKPQTFIPSKYTRYTDQADMIDDIDIIFGDSEDSMNYRNEV